MIIIGFIIIIVNRCFFYTDNSCVSFSNKLLQLNFSPIKKLYLKMVIDLDLIYNHKIFGLLYIDYLTHFIRSLYKSSLDF